MRRVIEPQDAIFANPCWHALRTEQANIALPRAASSGTALALRYPGDVIPFAGVERADARHMAALRDLLAPGEALFVIGDEVEMPSGMTADEPQPVLQMHFPEVVTSADKGERADIVELTAAHAGEMVHLTDVAFPGFFRARTYTLGRYFGIRAEGELVAMAGERMALPGWREVSAVCTHPAHRGKGYAAALIRQVLRMHAEAGLRSFLHLSQTNTGALALYERLGFAMTRGFMVRRVRRDLV